MGRQIADTASASLVREAEGGSELGYSYSAWCLAGLPHRDLPAGKEWLIETGFARLLVRPGIRLRDDSSRRSPHLRVRDRQRHDNVRADLRSPEERSAWTVYTLHCGHDVMLDLPNELTSLLLEETALLNQ